MAKRFKVTVTVEDDLLVRLRASAQVGDRGPAATTTLAGV